jgi:hypothetical protein
MNPRAAPHHRRQAGGEAEQELRFAAKQLQKRLLLLWILLRHLEQLQGDRCAEAAMVRAVHDSEATFGDHALDVVGGSDHATDDSEDVFSHRGSLLAQF